MSEWDLVFCAKTIKEKQEEMQLSFTKIIDALNSLKDENVHLSGIWKGNAETNFMSAFFKMWENAKDTADEMGNLIAAFTEIEKHFENAENEILKLGC
ncbi:MAG: hypothetical protein HDR23_07220 [Lachnospiraceae bacterium]|nr:hypothetical protein [Lachnospiraceae bacterium]